MASGVGVSPDSVIYLSAADRVNQGRGLTPIGFHFAPSMPSDRPLVIFPPAYSLLLATVKLITADSVKAAKYIHIVLFGITAFVLALIVYGATRSLWAVVCAPGVFMSSFAVLEIFTMAWSESLFVLTLLATLFALLGYLRRPNRWLFFGCAVLASVSVLTRYVGIVIVVPLALTLLRQENPLGEKIKRGLLISAIVVLPFAAWIGRNWLLTGSATGRRPALHLFNTSAGLISVNSLLRFVVPYRLPSPIQLLLIAGGAIIVFWTLWRGVRRRTGSTGEYVAFFSAVTIAAYVAFLIAYNSFADPAVDLESRLFLPVYLFGITLVFSLGFGLSGNPWRVRVMVILSVLTIAINAYSSFVWAAERHREGVGFLSRAWKESAAVNFAQHLPPQTVVHSNAADAYYLYTGQEAVRLPAKFDPMEGGRANPNFELQIAAVRSDVLNNRAIVIYFDRVDWRWYLPSRSELEELHKLPVLMRLSDGVVYGVSPQVIGKRQ
jgi:hypothetical protein